MKSVYFLKEREIVCLSSVLSFKGTKYNLKRGKIFLTQNNMNYNGRNMSKKKYIYENAINCMLIFYLFFCVSLD